MNMHVKTDYPVGTRLRRIDGKIEGVRDIGEHVTVVKRTSATADTSTAYIDAKGKVSWEPTSNFELDPNFAVGDKVRAIETSNGGAYKKGNIYTVRKVSAEYDSLETELDEHGSTTNGWRKTAFEPVAVSAPTYHSCAAAEVDNLADEYGGRKVGPRNPGYRFTAKDKPQPGDRVSIADQGTYTVRDVLANGNIRFTDRPNGYTWLLDYDAAVSACTLVQAAPTLTIQAGRHYKTRDGRKVGPMEERGYNGQMFDKSKAITGYGWNKDGSYLPSRSQIDLVAEWYEPIVAPATTTANFKVGDKVGCTTNTGCNYIVKGINAGGLVVAPLRKDGGEETYTFSNQDSGIFFLLPQPTTIADIVRKHSGTAVVMLIENGQPKPATRPYVHASRVEATTEAERLATTMPGSEFGVYELVTRRVGDVVVREVA